MIPEIIKKRTNKGHFAARGSSGTRARRYDPSYARKTGKSVGGPVDLYVSGDLYNAIKGKHRINSKSVTVYAEVVGSKAKQKVQWLEEMGAGKGRIKRRFLYLTKKEAAMVAREMLKASSEK